MTNASQPKMFQIWSKKIMLGLLKPGLHPDRLTIREKLVRYVDERGLNLNDSATLHTYENSEVIRQQIGLLDAASGTSAVPESGVTTTAGSSPATLGPVSWFGWSAVSSSRPDRARGVVHSRGQEWPQAIA